MFEKTLLDLVKGIRSHKDREAQYISDCIRECKDELGSSDLDLKAEALNKLTYVRFVLHWPPSGDHSPETVFVNCKRTHSLYCFLCICVYLSVCMSLCMYVMYVMYDRACARACLRACV